MAQLLFAFLECVRIVISLIFYAIAGGIVVGLCAVVVACALFFAKMFLVEHKSAGDETHL